MIVSNYHHEIYFNSYIGDFSDYVNWFITNKDYNWFRFHRDWVINDRGFQVLYVAYEELLEDKEKAVHKIAEFLNITFKEDVMDRIIERTSFDFMKRFELRFAPKTMEGTPILVQFIRQGKCGEGREMFDDEEVKMIESLLEEIPGPRLIAK